LQENPTDKSGGRLSGIPGEIKSENSDAGAVYNFDTIDVDGNPELALMCLKRMVGERGFEPPTPWSRTRFKALLNSIDSCRPEVIGVE
jgi:hypothetical protein